MKIQTKKEKKIVFCLICLGCITISFNVAAITASIPAIGQDLGLPDFLVSKIISYYMIPYGIGALIYAPLTKYYSYRRIIFSSMVIFSLSCFFCGISMSLPQILLFRVIMGIAGASAIPVGLMIVGEFFPKNIRGRLVGFFFGCSFFASLAGIALGGMASWRWLFYTPAILGSILVLFCCVLPLQIFKKIHGVDVQYTKIFKNKKIVNTFTFIIIISALYHAVHKWFGIFLSQAYNLDKLSISFLFIIAAVGGFIGQILGGILSDKISRRFTASMGIIGLSISTICLAAKFSFLTTSVAIVCISMFWTVGHNGISTVLTDFPDKYRPAIASLNSSLRFIFGGIGFYLSSFFVQRSFSAAFYVIGILMFLLYFSLKRIISEN